MPYGNYPPEHVQGLKETRSARAGKTKIFEASSVRKVPRFIFKKRAY